MQLSLPLGPAKAWTDGSLKKARFGGWGAVVLYAGQERVLSGAEINSTNQRMELLAAIEAASAVPVGETIHIVSDSKYVVNGIESWLSQWKRQFWRNSSGQVVSNLDLWKRMDLVMKTRSVSAEWVRGHDGHEMNERVDKIAQDAAREAMREVGAA